MHEALVCHTLVTFVVPGCTHRVQQHYIEATARRTCVLSSQPAPRSRPRRRAERHGPTSQLMPHVALPKNCSRWVKAGASTRGCWSSESWSSRRGVALPEGMVAAPHSLLCLLGDPYSSSEGMGGTFGPSLAQPCPSAAGAHLVYVLATRRDQCVYGYKCTVSMQIPIPIPTHAIYICIYTHLCIYKASFCPGWLPLCLPRALGYTAPLHNPRGDKFLFLFFLMTDL